MSIRSDVERIGNGELLVGEAIIALRDFMLSEDRNTVEEQIVTRAINFIDSRKFPAALTGNSTLPATISDHTARWEYEFNQIEFMLVGSRTSHTLEYIKLDNGIKGWAFNIDEVTHIEEPGTGQEWVVWGIDMHGDTISNHTLAPRPVGGGGTDNTHKVDRIVEITVRAVYRNAPGAGDDEVDLIYTFDKPGSIDGSC